MRNGRRAVIFIAATVAGLLMTASVATASGFTTVMTNGFSHGKSVFAAKPKQIVMDSADGGLLTITWTTWNGTEAIGHGTSRPDHGVYKISVKLSDPQFGTFQHFSTTYYKPDGKPGAPNILDLATTQESPTSNEWAPASWIKNKTASGLYLYQPAFQSCPNQEAVSAGGLYGISTNAACSIGTSDMNSHGLKCQNSHGGAYSIKSSYDGYTVTNEPTAGVLFERGDQYFTFNHQCSY
jgi:hypothetical protein